MNEKFPFTVTINQKNWHLVQQWCEKYIGNFAEDWYKLGIDPMQGVFDDNTWATTWLFRKKEHAILFSLRWV